MILSVISLQAELESVDVIVCDISGGIRITVFAATLYFLLPIAKLALPEEKKQNS